MHELDMLSRDGGENRSENDWEKELKEALADDSSMLGYLTNDRTEREIVEVSIQFTDARHFVKDPGLWLSKRLGDGKTTEVTYRRLGPGEQVQFDEAMVKELSQVAASEALRRVLKEELPLDETKLLKMRWVLTWKYQEGGERKAKARLVILGYQHPRLTEQATAAPTLGRLGRNLLLQACAVNKLKLEFGDVSSAFLQTEAKEEHQELYIRVPTEVAHLFLDELGHPSYVLKLVRSFYGLTTAPRAWWLDISAKLAKLGWKQLKTDRCLWVLFDEDGKLHGIIGVHVDDFLAGGAASRLFREMRLQLRSLYRWGTWTSGQSEFSGLRVRQYKNYEIELDLEDYTNKFITEASLPKERAAETSAALSSYEVSLYRGVLGTAGWRAQQVSPQYSVDVSLLLSRTSDPRVQDLLDANKLVRDMRRTSSQTLLFHAFGEHQWNELVVVQYGDASEKPRPDGSMTGGLVTAMSTDAFKQGQAAPVSLLGWRSFKLPRKIGGSNNVETQAMAFADETLWLTRLMWSEIHGVELRRWLLDLSVRTVPAMLVTDSRGIFDALTRHESPQLRLRSNRSGEEARGIKEQCEATDVLIRWVNGLAMLADSLTKAGYPSRHIMENFLQSKRWTCSYDPAFESAKKRQAKGDKIFEECTTTAAFEQLLADDSFSSDLVAIMRSRYQQLTS